MKFYPPTRIPICQTTFGPPCGTPCTFSGSLGNNIRDSMRKIVHRIHIFLILKENKNHSSCKREMAG